MERLPSIDVCRGIAVIGMVAGDIPTVMNISNYYEFLFIPGFFLFIAGVSYELFIISRAERHKNIITRNIETFWKAIILLAITQGIFFAGVMLFPSRFSVVFNSSLFLVISTGYLLSILIPSKLEYLIPIILVPFLLLNYLNTSIPGLFFFLFSDPFPLIPFISYFFAGRAIMIVYEKMNDLPMKNGKIVIFSAMFVAGMAIIFQVFLIPFTKTTRTEFLGFLLLAGLMICILSVLSFCRTRIKGFDFYLSPFERTGRIAFSAYYAFYAMELIIFPYINRVFIKYLDPEIQIIIYFLSIIIILLITTGIEKIWRKTGYKFGMEWALRYGSAYFTKVTMKVFALKA
jgi:hypothetical protein